MTGLSDAQHHRRIHQGGANDPRRSQTQHHGRAGVADRPVHPARATRIHLIRRWAGIYCSKSAGLECGCWRFGAKTAYIEPGSQWENGYCESFNARFRDELLNGEIFYSLREAQILIAKWRIHDNTITPHSALGYRPPTTERIVPIDQRPTMH